MDTRTVMPNSTVSTTPIPSGFQPPRTTLRTTVAQGLVDVHPGPIALANPLQGLNYQLWQVRADGTNIYLSAPNTPEFAYLPNTAAVWVALSFDQNGRPFIAWTADKVGTSYYYWYDTTIPGFRTSALVGPVFRVFAVMDDQRPLLIQNSDIILAYTRNGTLFTRVERDRFGVEYNQGAAPGKLVQLGMNTKLRLQFAFLNTTGQGGVPPQEWNPALGFNEPA